LKCQGFVDGLLQSLLAAVLGYQHRNQDAQGTQQATQATSPANIAFGVGDEKPEDGEKQLTRP
jgi:hypothetical protein